MKEREKEGKGDERRRGGKKGKAMDEGEGERR